MSSYYERTVVSFDASLNARFQYNPKEVDYTNQYNHMYLRRSKDMKVLLMNNIRNEWLVKNPNLHVIPRIVDTESGLNESIQEDCVIIGMVYKEMPLRSSVIKEIRDGYKLSGPLRPVNNYSSERDQIYLEDESGRILLSKKATISTLYSTLVTGVIIGIRGKFDSELGEFLGREYIFPGPILLPSTAEDHDMIPDELDTDPHVLFVSGLELGDRSSASVPSLALSSLSEYDSSMDIENDENVSEYYLACQLLVDFIGGRLGQAHDVALARKICRVVIAGNSIAPVDSSVSRDKQSMNRTGANNLESIKSIKQFDVLLSQILSSCPVDVIPGMYDPTGHIFPQQALRSSLFPHSSRFSSLHLGTNPYHCVLDNQYCLIGSSGQGIHDIALQSSNPSTKTMNDDNIVDEENFEFDILRRTFEWGHLFPTCPDTLSSYPYKNYDPFILDMTNPKHHPTIYYAGNQIDYHSEIVSYVSPHDGSTKKTLLLSIPTFRLSRSAVLVNLRTLNVKVLSFQDLNLTSNKTNPEKVSRDKLFRKKGETNEESNFEIDFTEEMELEDI